MVISHLSSTAIKENVCFSPVCACSTWFDKSESRVMMDPHTNDTQKLELVGVCF